MPTEQEFQALVRRIEKLEGFKDEATAGLLNHKEGIEHHTKAINDLNANLKKVGEAAYRALESMSKRL